MKINNKNWSWLSKIEQNHLLEIFKPLWVQHIIQIQMKIIKIKKN